MEKYITYKEEEIKKNLTAMRNTLKRLKGFKDMSNTTIQDEIDRLNIGINTFRVL